MAEYQVDANGFIIRNDIYDVGVPMRPAPAGWVHTGRENAYDSDTRGDYTGRQLPRIHYRRGRYNLWGEFEPDGRGEGSHG